MIELLTAINALLTTGPMLAAFPGGAYLRKGPPGKVDKYCIFGPISAPNTATFGTASIVTEPEIQFSAWTNDALDALALVNLIVTTLDTDDLTLTGGKRVANVLRLSDPLPMPDSGEQDENGLEMFGWFVTYRFAVS